ncbi:MAG TPA: hypothetical protein VJY34_25900 [Roseiarcus sp.]|nr:hypothetical protein [Roseiarcus sp.]
MSQPISEPRGAHTASAPTFAVYRRSRSKLKKVWKSAAPAALEVRVHLDLAERVRIASIRPFAFDERLWRRRDA